ncbi:MULTISPECIES: hypothetical protein [Streptomyces]|uniref:Uncharacterized protein n=1 Tax=Streptomyces virginiae TaxID=1961 RepID=A0ABQ3NPY4_STRVG|nr:MULTISPECIES: hypothetical protein [Streptomyces]KOU95875.1 hypothetical protein ADK92_18945 [Streptomyces sp. XY533]MBP2341298.1 hypothetical protein [Streptomyces virginiae]MCI4079029.1 hypothetical protein [Streptomyces sp. MMS21 TC-5]GGQ19441.1 hypothetical protein GCM10010215_50130 [Streptomyces virginiae]GHI14843.1 hypothetical protein Scinn_43060 [Streptomyces virginiae]
MTLILTSLREFFLHDVLGNLTAAAFLTTAAWSTRTIRAARAARRHRNSSDQPVGPAAPEQPGQVGDGPAGRCE